MHEKEIRLIIAGCRDFYDKEIGFEKIDEIAKYIQTRYPDHKLRIISGGASGADRLGEAYARNNKIELTVFPADWNSHGRSAGPTRNKKMLDFAMESEKPYLLAFWDMKSPGTKNMIDISRKEKIPIYLYDINSGIMKKAVY